MCGGVVIIVVFTVVIVCLFLIGSRENLMTT